MAWLYPDESDPIEMEKKNPMQEEVGIIAAAGFIKESETKCNPLH